MTYIAWIKPKSIKTINYLFFIILFYINLLFYLYDKLDKHLIMYLSVNCLLLMYYLLTNIQYEREYNSRKKDIEKLIYSSLNWNTKEVKEILKKEIKYQENVETYKLFKNMYITKNLVAKDYQDLKKVFLKFIPEDFLKEVWDKWTEKILPWLSVKKNLNVMFLDIIWFSSITEKISPEKALLLLNIYFDWMVKIIKENWGYVDKFLGDGIMAIFDWKKSDNAINAAILIQDLMHKLNIIEVGNSVSIWIWINSGEVILWTIWSNNRMEITIIWDVVNTASRIEWLTRTYKNGLLISESTYLKISNHWKYNFEDLGFHELRWKKTKIKIYWIKKQ